MRYPTNMSDNGDPIDLNDQIASKPKPSGNRFLRALMNLIMVIVLAILGVLVWQRVMDSQASGLIPFIETGSEAVASEPDQVEESLPDDVSLAPYQVESEGGRGGIARVADFETDIPTRPATEVMTYTVTKGDTLFEIADKFSIRPETVLFGNYDVLKDNPHILAPGMVLNILPVDGAYYEWKDGDSVDGVANYFRIDPEEIIRDYYDSITKEDILACIRYANSLVEEEEVYTITGTHA